MKTKKLNILMLLVVITFTTFSCAKNTATAQNTVPKAIENPVQVSPIVHANADEFKAKVEGKDVQLVDVRTPKEFNAGHIENAANINIFDKNFMEQMAKYKTDTPLYVYCRSGGRSMKAAKKLKAKGYNVINLDGGMIGWSAKGFKTIK